MTRTIEPRHDPAEVDAIALGLARARGMEDDLFPPDQADECAYRREARIALDALADLRTLRASALA